MAFTAHLELHPEMHGMSYFLAGPQNQKKTRLQKPTEKNVKKSLPDIETLVILGFPVAALRPSNRAPNNHFWGISLRNPKHRGPNSTNSIAIRWFVS